MITREQIEKRIAELEALKAQHLASANACVGAIEDCRHWLASLDEADDEPPLAVVTE